MDSQPGQQISIACGAWNRISGSSHHIRVIFMLVRFACFFSSSARVDILSDKRADGASRPCRVGRHVCMSPHVKADVRWWQPVPDADARSDLPDAVLFSLVPRVPQLWERLAELDAGITTSRLCCAERMPLPPYDPAW